jgi:hypothetical protein
MKRMYSLCLLLYATHVHAQFVKSVGVSIGTTVASQEWFYKLSGQTVLKDYAQGNFLSVNAELLKGKFLTIVTEVAYAQKGCREGLPDVFIRLPKYFSTYRTYDTRFNYLSSSVLLKARMENGKWIPYCFGGARMDYQLSYSSDYNFKALEEFMNEKIWGMDLGFGLEYKILHGGVSAEFRHHYDFDPLLDMPNSDARSGLAVQNNAYIFNIGIKYYFRNPKRIPVKPV